MCDGRTDVQMYGWMDTGKIKCPGCCHGEAIKHKRFHRRIYALEGLVIKLLEA